MEVAGGEALKPLFTGKINMTKHAKQRAKERGIDATYITRQLAFIPFEEGSHTWYIPRTDLFVAYLDRSEQERVIMTVARRIKEG